MSGVAGVTEGTLVGGKILFRQLAAGHRSGFEPVFLAAAVPAKAGDAVLEAGCGAGAALLCLARRVPGLTGVGLEIDPVLTGLANENFKINGFEGFMAVTGNAAHPPAQKFDHVLANPPWHGEASTNSPDAARARAHHAPAGLLGTWIPALAACVKHRGTVSLILPAAAVTEAVTALRENDFGGRTLFPFWPRAGQAAKFFIISARKHIKSPDRILPGLVLHDEGGITSSADAILREGSGLSSYFF